MADSGNVVDELVVKLRLDAKQYDQETKKVDKIVDRTEKKLVDKDKKGKKRDDEQKKRMQESTKAVKQLSEGFSKLALTMGAVAGVAATLVTGTFAAVGALANMDASLRVQSAGANLSVKQMRAWGAAAQRLGVDANSGRAAIVALAKEQQQFALTGNAPMMQALSRMGVNIGPNSKLEDVLGKAQQIYRSSAPAQQKQEEAMLSASGVPAEIIEMLKSPTDALEAFNRSLRESTDENRKADEAWGSMMASISTAVTNVQQSLANVLQPAVKSLADWATQGAQGLATFVGQIAAAGGGFDGFQKVLDKDVPQIGEVLHALRAGLAFLGQAVDVATYGFKEIGRAGKALFDWLDTTLARFGIGNGAHPLTSAVHTVGSAVSWAWTNTTGAARAVGKEIAGEWGDVVADARADGGPIGARSGDTTRVALTSGARASLATGGSLASIKLSGSMHDQAVQVMSALSASGFSPAAAAAIAANMFRESSFKANAFNPAGGGQGAMGSMQWRGARIDAFRRMFGIAPDQATFGQQVQFMLNDPYERGRLNKALEGGGTAQQYGERVAQIFEGVGKNAEKETSMRGALANQFSQWQNQTDAALGPGEAVVHISGPVTVQANSPQDFVGAITRVSGVQSYNSAVR